MTAAFCQCGCGERTTRMRYANRTQGGYEAGDYRRFVNGHGNIKPERYTVDDNGCWRWDGPLTADGYGGEVKRNGRRMLAYVWFWIRENGPVPDGLELDHRCRNRACVNPAHLEPVTRAVNTRRGLATKLDEAKVRTIRERRQAGERTLVLAREFGVTQRHIYDITSGKNWADVGEAA